jgi:phosphatidylserine decarboxylase
MKQGDIPVDNDLGNHDFSVPDDKKKRVPKLLGLNKRYYSLVKANWRFICLTNQRAIR